MQLVVKIMTYERKDTKYILQHDTPKFLMDYVCKFQMGAFVNHCRPVDQFADFAVYVSGV